MNGIHVTSEIGKLKKVCLHRPGDELLNLPPDELERLLFDDVPYLEVAQQEHGRSHRPPPLRIWSAITVTSRAT